MMPCHRRFVVPLRDQKHILLNGVDIGYEIKLPDLIQYNIGPVEMINHSCRMYTAGITMKCAIEKAGSEYVFELLGEIFKRCVN